MSTRRRWRPLLLLLTACAVADPPSPADTPATDTPPDLPAAGDTLRALRQIRDLLSDLADGVEDALAGDQEGDGDDDSEEGPLVDGDDAEPADADALDAPEPPAGGVDADEPVVPEGA